jgi:dethiobiotin synthetase
MSQPIFVTGIGTDVGKTIVSAVLTEALHADYWKPVQAGFYDGTDALTIKELISNNETVIHPEVYKLSLAASPHIAARIEHIKIDLNLIAEKYHLLKTQNSKAGTQKQLIIEGAGGLMVPLNEKEFMFDLIQKLNARVILVSRNYLGSINHSLLTAGVCKQKNIEVAGWIFNDQYMDYEHEIVQWTGWPKIFSMPFAENLTKEFISGQAEKLKASLQKFL